ncbi:antibiotic biosynthesis monooxygenase [Neobacillus sp. DY30]|uniref:antibiotic biosynthesis monooxygenase family protein n=1 Tax=Neobacillus sp. DY30 TaxID=3047871 RepID=UPI0024BF9F0F|nr:antibiotic biosynthesis monooxygenase [Neobacillus sp. DY30]WHY02031.1 antibiotic biosynthesis monooxygenase [Neobacillus sp. DY30]
MNAYITTGTFEYLKGIEMSYPAESMVTMVNEDSALLIHETTKPSHFKEPSKYEVLASSGLIEKKGYVVIYNIPVPEESRPLFEYRLKDLPNLIEKEMGLNAIRIFRPLSSNTYIILTAWESALTFENSKTLLDSSIKKSYENVNYSNIFTSAPYVSKYTISAE